ncbi:unnamed protein product [Mycena citricolor]|uniref:Uncharacterized protein n=1 Tax=Mycena citricolor TaxID=2018698 RepID=A0AAD2HVX9_9AGAR|nr:unnamed protein product [Mycena citricolor]
MPTRHILTILSPAWGHVLPYIHLTTKLLASDPELVITIVEHNVLVAKMLKEFSLCSYDTSRLKIEGVGDKDLPTSLATVEQSMKELTAGWLDLLAKAVSGQTTWPKPHTLHMDFNGGGLVVKESMSLLGPDGKILLWCSTGVAACMIHFSEFNHAKTAREIYADENKRAGRSLDDIIGDVCCASNGSDKLDGRILEIAGGIKIYDHEHMAQGAGSPRAWAALLTAGQELAQLADGFFCPTSGSLESAAAPHARAYYKQRGKELFLVGPQMRDDEWEAPSAGPGPSDERLKTFLGEALKNYGPKSVLYISFGCVKVLLILFRNSQIRFSSMFFPVETPHLVEVMIEVLLSLESVVPFVFVVAGVMASLPNTTVDRIHASGRGIVCTDWVDQKAILKSGTVGWFLTHGGYNSLIEALSQGIPLIFWPIGAEQALNAAMFSTGPRAIGIELFQIRTGTQLGPSLRPEAPKITGTAEDAKTEFQHVFKDIKRTRGETLRQNAIHIGDLWREERLDGEPAQEIARLARF